MRRSAAMRVFLPWLIVLGAIITLNALHMKPLASALAVGWLGYCIWTWIRPRDRG